ncbi:hypothetical protein [Deinococcus marmoris]|nr:hypothetical protein [Deinococcus marmoris]
MTGIREEVEMVVGAALAGGPGVTVIRAVPGGGKTSGAIAAAVARLPERTLWAVRETVGSGQVGAAPPLAEQTAQGFMAAAGQNVTQIVLGHAHLDDDAYHQQFTWDRPVAVVSHAHLPLLLQPGLRGALGNLREASGVVIDEDPLSALSLHVGITIGQGQLRGLPLANLAEVLRPHATCVQQQVAVDMLAALARGWPLELRRHLKSVHAFAAAWPSQRIARCMLRGSGFWALIGPALQILVEQPAADTALRAAIAGHLFPRLRGEEVSLTTRERLADLLVDALLDDLVTAGEGQCRRRCGLVWKGDFTSTYPKVLAFDILQPTLVDRPIVVLDAYASETQYRAIFGSDCRILDVGARRPLRVQLAPQLSLDSARSQPRKAVLVAREILAHAARSLGGQVLLAPRGAHKAVQQALSTAADLTSVSAALPGLAHWYSGRGNNTFVGQDTRALTLPHLPAVVRECSLTALFPLETDQAARTALMAHHERSELLQMLHRGRQLQFAPTSAPRAILHALPCALCPEHARATCNAQDHTQPTACMHWGGDLALELYAPAVPVTPGSPNPMFGSVLADVARDLEQSCGGVALIALEALGLVVPRARGAAHRAQLLTATRALLALGKVPALSALSTWRGRWNALSGTFPARRGVVWQGLVDACGDRSRRPVEEVLDAGGWAGHAGRSRYCSRRRPPSGRRTRPRPPGRYRACCLAWLFLPARQRKTPDK